MTAAMPAALNLKETQRFWTDDEVIRAVQRILKDNVVKEPPVPLGEIAKNYGYTIKPIEFPAAGSRFISVLQYTDRVVFLDKAEKVPMQNWGLARAFAYGELYPTNAMMSALDARTNAGTSPTKINPPPTHHFVERRPVAAKAPPEEQRADSFAALLLVPNDFLDKYRFADTKTLAELFIAPEEVIRWRRSW